MKIGLYFINMKRKKAVQKKEVIWYIKVKNII